MASLNDEQCVDRSFLAGGTVSSRHHDGSGPAPSPVSRRGALAAGGLGIASSMLRPAAAAASGVSPTAYTLEGEWTRVGSGQPLGYGIATDGTSVFLRRQANAGIVREVGFDGTLIRDHTISNATTSDILVAATPGTDDGRSDLAISQGYLFIRSRYDGTVNTGSALYAMAISDATMWDLRQASVPVGAPLLLGEAYTTGNLLDLPDGRIGCLSRPTGSGSNWSSTLRLYTVNTAADPIALTFDRDITIPDTVDWPTDGHGIASDGTFLHQLGWTGSAYQTRTWALPTSGTTATLISAPAADTIPGDVPTWMAHDHVGRRFLIGNFSGTNLFYIASL